MEGLDYILLRKHKTSFGDNKHKPHAITKHNTKSQPNCQCSKCRPDLYMEN